MDPLTIELKMLTPLWTDKGCFKITPEGYWSRITQ